jgi:hypothetical protein
LNHCAFKLFIAAHLFALLISCGGGGSSAVTEDVNNSTATAPYIYAELNSYSEMGQSDARVAVRENSTDEPIVSATVVLNNIILSYNSNDQFYEGHVTIHPGDTASLIVTVGTNTYAATSSQFTSYPTISSPQAGSTWHSGIDNTVTWSIGTLNRLPTMYGLGILDADNPGGPLVWPPDNYLKQLTTDTRSYSIPANTLTPGNCLVLVGISSFVSIPNAAPDSMLIISGFDYIPIVVTYATLRSVSITPANPTIPKGTNQQFRTIGYFSDNSTLDITSQVTWESSAISKVTIDPSGLAHGIGVGSSIITSRIGGFSDATILDVTPATLEYMTISPSIATIDPGASMQFTATGTYSDGSTQDLTGLASWASSDEGVAAISNNAGSNGKASAYRTGTTTITAASGNVSATATLTVAQLVSIEVTPADMTITKNSKLQFTATGAYSDGGMQDITAAVIWNSSNSDVATIDNTPGSQGNATSVGSGTATISAEADGISGSTTMTVSVWRSQALSSLQSLYAVIWSGSQFVAVGGFYPGSGCSILTSPDGLTWTSQSAGITYTLYDVVWSGKQFVAVGNHGSILTSPDGVIWTVQSSGTTLNLSAIIWSGTRYIAVGEVGIVLSSNDGITWSSQRIDNSLNSLYGIAYSGSQFVVTGDFGSIYTSPDGTNWTSRSQGYGNFLGIIWSDTQFVIAGWNGTGAILTSPDGVIWTSRNTGTDSYLYGVGRCNDQFLALGGGIILTSSDGATWSTSASGTWNNLSGVACSGSESVIVGNEVILMNP